MEKRLTMFLASLLLCFMTAMAQTKVTGTVVSQEDGQPIVGAAVKIVGTNQGVLTDMNGKFTVTPPAGKKTLLVTYIGMESKEVQARDGMVIELKSEASALDEVMVVAYGTAKKSAFTGSAAVVGSEKLTQHTTTNVADALVGSVAGLQMRGGSGAPGASQGSINIRGIASMFADTDPLVIVDGSPYTASLSNIPPGDIESVTVLKDAASAALYGARGAAGVILITTKKGENNNVRIDVDMKWGSNSRAIQDYETITDPAQYYEAYYSQLYNRYFYSDGMSAQAASDAANVRMLKDLAYNVFDGYEGNLIGLDGKINPAAKLGRKHTAANGTEYYLTPDNWTDLAYRNSFRQEYTVSATAGNDKSHFYASMGYLNDDGVIQYSGFERVTGRLKADYQLKKWMKLGANVGYVHSKTTSNPNLDTSLGSTNLMYYTSMIAPIYPAYIRVLDENGNPKIMTDSYGNEAYDFGVANNPDTGYMGMQRTFSSTGNPLGSNRYNNVYNMGDQLNATFTADIIFTDWLKANITSNVNWDNSTYSNYQNALYGPKTGVNGEITKSSTNSLRTNNTQTLNFYKDFGLHSVTALVGHEYYKTSTRYLGATANGGFSPDIQEINAFANKVTSNSYLSEYNVEGYFGSAQYSYDDKYFGSVSYRRDGSSVFAKDNRWGNFWSVGGAWIISKEKFMDGTDSWLDQLKVKASIGQQGNDNIGNWAYTDLYSLKPNATNTGMSPSFSRLGNKDITWETTTNFNAGVEFSFFKGRLTGNFDFYTKKTTDLLFWLSVPEASAGSRGYYGNVGDIRNTGVELVLSGDIIRTKTVNWSLSANFSHNTTKILSLPETKTAENGGFTDSSFSEQNYSCWYAVGGPLYNAFLKEAGVDEHGKAYFWQDTDMYDAENDQWITSRPGKKRDKITYDPNEATYYEQGSLLPKVFGGVSSTLRVGSFDATVTFDFQLGGKVYDSRYMALMTPCTEADGQTFHKDIFKAWTPNNTSSNIPRWEYGADNQYAAAKSSRWLTSANYLNFQSFTVGYTLPRLLKEVSKIRLYVAGENIAFWSARKGLDPRYAYAGNKTMNVYSPTRTISGGIQVSF